MPTPEQDLLAFVDRAQANLDNDEMFHEAFSRAWELLSLKRCDIVSALPVDGATVEMWRDGKAAPRPLMRPAVYSFITERLKGGPFLRWMTPSEMAREASAMCRLRRSRQDRSGRARGAARVKSRTTGEPLRFVGSRIPGERHGSNRGTTVTLKR